MKKALLLSLLLHATVVLLLTFHLPGTLQKSGENVVKVQLMTPQKAPKQEHNTAPKPPANIRTQASLAPKEAPKPKPKPAPQTVATKVVTKEKPKEVVEQPKPKEEKAEKRPPKLDKTPDKKIVQNDDPDAKTVTDPDDFLKTLDFIDDLATKQEEDVAAPEEESAAVSFNLSDQAEIAKLKTHIEKSWLRPPGLNVGELGAVVEVRLTPDGMIQSLKLVESSGKVHYDNSLLRAVRKAEPLPIPVNRYDKFKILELYFKG